MTRITNDPTCRATVLVVTGAGINDDATPRTSWQAMEARDESPERVGEAVVKWFAVTRVLPGGPFSVKVFSMPLVPGSSIVCCAALDRTLTHDMHGLRSWGAVKKLLMGFLGVDECRDFVVIARKMDEAARKGGVS